MKQTTIGCPKCGSNQLQTIDNEALLHHTKGVVDTEIYAAVECTDCQHQFKINGTINWAAPTTTEQSPVPNDKEIIDSVHAEIFQQSPVVGEKEAKLIRWAKDGYPPIDLNKNVGEVTVLVHNYQQLAASNKILREALQRLYNSVDSCIELTPEVMKQAKEALSNTK